VAARSTLDTTANLRLIFARPRKGCVVTPIAMVTVRFSSLAKMVSSNGQGSLSHVVGVTRKQRRSAAVITQSPKRFVWMLNELTAHSIGFACRGLANFACSGSG
jgi:hypothetical protein